jgi:Trk K+ transport system NAD-binding subunit
VGKTVAALDLPSSVLIVSLRREGHVEAVHGNTRLIEGDQVIVLVEPKDIESAMRCLTGEELGDGE